MVKSIQWWKGTTPVVAICLFGVRWHQLARVRRPTAAVLSTTAVNEVVVNGERRAIEDGLTVRGLLVELGLDPSHVAVERNREIVPRASFDVTTLQPDDTLEIVTFVGGG